MQTDGPQPARARLSRRSARQDALREAEYAALLARWQYVERLLIQAEHLIQALGAQPARRPADPALPLHRGERVLAVLPALVLVEVSRPAGTTHPEYARYAARVAAELALRRPSLPAEPQRVRGHGAVTLTDQRVVFHGPAGLTEWPLDKVTLIEHATGRPVSLLHLRGAESVHGLLSRPRDAARVRLLLEYAAAEHAGEVARLQVGLGVERRLHELDRPAPPRHRGTGTGGTAGTTAGRGARSAGGGTGGGAGHGGGATRVIRAATVPITEPAIPRRRGQHLAPAALFAALLPRHRRAAAGRAAAGRAAATNRAAPEAAAANRPAAKDLAAAVGLATAAGRAAGRAGADRRGAAAGRAATGRRQGRGGLVGVVLPRLAAAVPVPRRGVRAVLAAGMVGVAALAASGAAQVLLGRQQGAGDPARGPVAAASAPGQAHVPGPRLSTARSAVEVAQDPQAEKAVTSTPATTRVPAGTGTAIIAPTRTAPPHPPARHRGGAPGASGGAGPAAKPPTTVSGGDRAASRGHRPGYLSRPTR